MILALIKAKGAAVGGKSCVLDECFGLLDGGEAVILQDVLFDDDAIDVVSAGVQPELAKRKSHAKERNFDVWHIVEVQAGKREQLEVFVAADMADGELVGLRLECPHDKALEAVGDVLRFADVFQMLDDFFGGFGAADDDVCAAGEAFFMASGKRVAPLLCGELSWAQNLAHAVGEDFCACTRHGTETRVLENVEQLVERNVVEFCNADKFNWRKTAHFDAQFLREHFQYVGVIAERNILVDAPLQKDLVGAFGFCFERFLADFVQTQDVRLGAVGWAAKTAKAACHFAHVRVVHDAECSIAHAVSGELCVAHGVGGLDDFCPWDVR